MIKRGTASSKKKRDYKKVRCQSCGRKYQSIGVGIVQGLNMASVVQLFKTGFVLTCHYGSDFDTDIYAIIGNTNFKVKKGIHVCDACIRIELDKSPPTLRLEPYNIFS